MAPGGSVPGPFFIKFRCSVPLPRPAPHMMHGGVVSLAESIPVVPAHLARNEGRMPELVAVVRVRRTVILKVLPRAFDAVVIAALLELAELLRRSVPAARTLSITRGRRRRRSITLRKSSAGYAQQCNSKCRCCKSCQFHKSLSLLPFVGVANPRAVLLPDTQVEPAPTNLLRKELPSTVPPSSSPPVHRRRVAPSLESPASGWW